MNHSKISIRYSRALFESAIERNIIGRINQDMIRIYETCAMPDVRELLNSPVIVPSRKTEILHKVFGEDLHSLTLSLIDLTVKNGRESSIPDIARVFIHDTMKHNGITETILTTAVKAAPEVRDRISELVSDLFRTKVDLKEYIDENIIGGFILKVDDNYFDASIRNKLRKIGRGLAEGPAATE